MVMYLIFIQIINNTHIILLVKSIENKITVNLEQLDNTIIIY